MKAAPRRLVVEWILKSWNELNLDTIKDSFKYCALTLNVDGTEDDIISCFKSDKPCAAGKKVLNEQMLLLNDEAIHEDPFQPTDSDIEEANHPENNIEYEDVDYDVEV